MTNQIHNLDCIDFMKTLPNESIDLTITGGTPNPLILTIT